MSSEQKQEVLELEVDKIQVPEERVTSVVDDEIMLELEESIKQHGILQPLQVAKVNDQYVLIDGLHRLQVAQKLGMKTVPAIVKEMTEDELLVTNLIVNRQRGKSNPAQEAMILKKLVDEYGYDFDRAAQMLGMGRATADRYYKIASNASQNVLQYLGQGAISVGCAYWLSYIEDKDKQNEAADNAVRWGYTVDQCKAAAMSAISPQEETPYIVMPTGEIKPKPIPVYPCGKEVEPGRIVTVQFDSEVWQIVQQALQQLCQEGFFYNEQPQQQPQQITEEPQQVEEPKPQQVEKKKDWFFEKL